MSRSRDSEGATGSVTTGSAMPRDPLLDHFFPPGRSWRRSARDFLGNLALGCVVFAAAALVLWAAYREAVLPLYGRAVLALGFERGRSVEELREDLRFLRAALEHNHPALYAHQTPEEMAAAFDAAEGRLRSGMSAADLLREAAPLVAAVGCGHTGLRAPMSSVRAVVATGRLLPMGVRTVAGRTYVVHHYGRGVEVPLGAELLAMNGVPMGRIIDRLVASLPSDRRSRTYNLALAEARFPYWYWVFVDRSPSCRVRYRGPDAEAEREAVVKARPTRSILASLGDQHPELDPTRPPPAMRTEVLAGRRLAYLRLYTFVPQHRPESRAALHAFFRRIAETGVETLVVDVRGNAGGPPPVSVDLLRYLLSKPFVYLQRPERPELRALGYDRYYEAIEPHVERFAGRVFVLIDAGSFSTTGHFLAHLAVRHRAVFVGQESGGGALCYDGSRNLELPHTGLRLRVATLPFLAAGAERLSGGGIVPDYAVSPTVDDLVAGRDTAMGFLLDRFGLDLRPVTE